MSKQRTDEQLRLQLDIEHRRLRISSLRAKIKRIEPYGDDFDKTIAAIDKETRALYQAQAAYEASIRNTPLGQA
ncbi:MAG: hypothetical protein EOM54_13870 [Clostridia bacterium]|nr:hypothetical protein [Clostridia bacterium]